MTRCTMSLLLVLLTAACGRGGSNQAPPIAKDPAYGGPPVRPLPDANDESGQAPAEDAEPWRRVIIPAPEGWLRLGKEGRTELTRREHGLLAAPPAEHVLLAAWCSHDAPHASSGSDDDWAAWRESVSVALVYTLARELQDPLAELKARGANFLEGFEPDNAQASGAVATYIHKGAPEKRLAAVSNGRGTYILVGLARDAAAQTALDELARQIKPE
jgi:hypothetical protein